MNFHGRETIVSRVDRGQHILPTLLTGLGAQG